MLDYLELPIGAKSPEVVNAVIEVPFEGLMTDLYDKIKKPKKQI